MNRTKTKPCKESAEVAGELERTGSATPEGEYNYINFIKYCAERIGRGDSAQAIWRGYQEITAKK